MMQSPEHIETAKRAFRELGIKSIPKKPADLNAPGCASRPGVVYWIARQDIADRGYPTKTVPLWKASPGCVEPTPEQWEQIAKSCGRLQREMLAWGRTSRLNSEPAGTPQKVEIAELPPLTLTDWRDRDLPEPDFLMGHWVSTTSRALVTAATGLGKTNFGLALGIRGAAGQDFLHWRAHRPARVLYIDGEMSRRLLKQRVLDEAQRLGASPETFFALSHEDIPSFKPLNTIEGQAWMNALIDKIGGVDLVIADNIMSLTVGDMKDGEPWQQTLPWVLSLTKAAIGQIWIHHTGHDETRSYGDKTREWQMDTVAHLDAVKRDETDLSFSMSFKKARERTPTTRFDFQDVKIALVNDRWEYELTDTRRPGKVSPQTQKALDALINVLAGDQVEMLSGGRRAAHRDQWISECNARGLIDAKRNEKSATTMFNRFRRELVAANLIACEGDLQWLLR
jgi:AAA domain